MDASKMFVGILIIAVAITPLQGMNTKLLCKITEVLVSTERMHGEISNLRDTYGKKCKCATIRHNLPIQGKRVEILKQVRDTMTIYFNLLKPLVAKEKRQSKLNIISHWLRYTCESVEKLMLNITANSTVKPKCNTRINITWNSTVNSISSWIADKLKGINANDTGYHDMATYFTLCGLTQATISIRLGLNQIVTKDNRTLNCTQGKNGHTGPNSVSTMLISNVKLGQVNGTNIFFNTKKQSKGKSTGR